MMNGKDGNSGHKGHVKKSSYQVIKKNKLSSDVIKTFQKVIYTYYKTNRRAFPWRKTRNPYHILISEIMLQQTQTDRVIEKYEQFITQFKDFFSLAQIPLQEILRQWQGMGYNRRAVALKNIARIVVEQFQGRLPSSVEVLMTLPGIGRTTASAIAAFAFNAPTVFIETNIRSVFIHFFFQDRHNVKDCEILPFIEKTLDTSNPRKWYYALMDYGVMLKKLYPDLGKRSGHYKKQTPFKGSNRQVRGMILKALTATTDASEKELIQTLYISAEQIRKNLIQLEKEGFIKRTGKRFLIV